MCGRIEPERGAPHPADQHQRRDHRQPDRQPDPDANSLPAARERQPHPDPDADRPIADEREDHRHARVVEPAQHARADDLRAIDDLEDRGDPEERHRKADHPRIGRDRLEEQPDQRVRERPDDHSHRGHEPDPERVSGPAGPRDPGLVAAPEGQADADRRRLAKTHRHHEGQRRDLQRDGVGGERFGIDQPHQIGRRSEHRALEPHRQPDRQPEAPHPAKARPVGPPPPPEQMEATKLAVAHDDDRQPDRQPGPDDRAGQPGAEHAPGRQSKMTEDQRPAEQGVGDNPDRADRQNPPRPLERGDEISHALEQ